jgi:hypothetical protein
MTTFGLISSSSARILLIAYLQIQMIVFTDYRLIGDFVEKCRKDIEGKDCGRVSMKTHSDTQVFYHHSQVLQTMYGI